MPLLCLHGIAQENNSQEYLCRLWRDSLQEGLGRAGIYQSLPGINMPYFGDLLAGLEHQDTRKPNSCIDENLRCESVGAVSTEVESVLRSRLEGREDVDENLRGFTKSLVSLISRVIGSDTEAWAIDAVLSQVERYLTVLPIRDQIVARATSELEKCDRMRLSTKEPLVVVAHSLGSVVALDMLAATDKHQVDLLMTLGSPLSIKSVHSRLSQQPAQWPKAVTTWINISDPDDIVALYGKIDRSNFFRKSFGINNAGKCDVMNVLDIRNHMANHHGIAGYLDDPVVARIVLDALKNCS